MVNIWLIWDQCEPVFLFVRIAVVMQLVKTTRRRRAGERAHRAQGAGGCRRHHRQRREGGNGRGTGGYVRDRHAMWTYSKRYPMVLAWSNRSSIAITTTTSSSSSSGAKCIVLLRRRLNSGEPCLYRVRLLGGEVPTLRTRPNTDRWIVSENLWNVDGSY